MPKYGPKALFNKYGEFQNRASSIKEEDRYREDGTDEWYTTEDGYPFAEGDRLYNYYDGEWVIVGKMAYEGWFDTYRDIDMTQRGATLNSIRMSKHKPER